MKTPQWFSKEAFTLPAQIMSGLIVAAVTGGAFFKYYEVLSARIAGFEQPLLLLSFMVFVFGAAALTFIAVRAGESTLSVGIGLAAIVIFFLIALYFLPNVTASSHLILILPNLAVVVLFLFRAGLTDASLKNSKRNRHNIGFAATGVLVDVSDPSNKRFLLVLNRNLRDSKGLWVPPGGHVDIYSERPDEKVVQKVLAETGYEAAVLDTPSGMLPDRIDQRQTDLCTWLKAPAFLLKEDLLGACSKFHKYHIDFVYLLASQRRNSIGPVKYDRADQLWIALTECTASYEAAKSAVHRAVERWHHENSLAVAGLSDNITNDVVWRLHLASKFVVGIDKQPQLESK